MLRQTTVPATPDLLSSENQTGDISFFVFCVYIQFEIIPGRTVTKWASKVGYFTVLIHGQILSNPEELF